MVFRGLPPVLLQSPCVPLQSPRDSTMRLARTQSVKYGFHAMKTIWNTMLPQYVCCTVLLSCWRSRSEHFGVIFIFPVSFWSASLHFWIPRPPGYPWEPKIEAPGVREVLFFIEFWVRFGSSCGHVSGEGVVERSPACAKRTTEVTPVAIKEGFEAEIPRGGLHGPKPRPSYYGKKHNTADNMMHHVSQMYLLHVLP